MIPNDFIDELLSRTDIVDVVGSRLKLKKTGQNHTALCPFHNEKSPSFSVSEDKQFYYCFGCQASGNALKFVMEFDRLDFIPAVELLASRAGLEVPSSNRTEPNERVARRKSIHEILDQASSFYCDALRHHPDRHIAVDYLKSRNLSGEIARDFSLGYAPAGWENLCSALAKTNHERELLIEAGLAIEKEGGDRVYDRFRDRVMFPIRDLRGRVIAFGGRIIGDGRPKYLNSPETPVFHKGRELYGLYEARKRNRGLDSLLVVEGYMDVVALAQHGVNNVVATLGTATTAEHLERLYRMVSRIVFCFDGDEAGRNAGWKALLVALPHLRDGRSARFLFVPDGEDPDSLVRAEGADRFRQRIDDASELADFFFTKLASEVDMASLDGKARLSTLAMPLIGRLPAGVYQELIMDRLSELTNLTSEKLLSLAQVPEPAYTAAAPAAARPVVEASEDDQPGDDSPPDEAYPDYLADEYDAVHADDPVNSAPVRPSPLAQKALSMLLVQPELAVEVIESDLAALERDAGAALLLRVLREINDHDLRSPIVLLGRFQNDAEFSHLKKLAELEQLLPVSGLVEEFTGTLRSIVRHQDDLLREALREQLLAKPLGELTDAEKLQLRTLTGR